MGWFRTAELHLGLRLQVYKAEHPENQSDQRDDQINNPHGVLLLLKRTGTTGRLGPPLAGSPDVYILYNASAAEKIRQFTEM